MNGTVYSRMALNHWGHGAVLFPGLRHSPRQESDHLLARLAIDTGCIRRAARRRYLCRIVDGAHLEEAFDPALKSMYKYLGQGRT